MVRSVFNGLRNQRFKKSSPQFETRGRTIFESNPVGTLFFLLRSINEIVIVHFGRLTTLPLATIT